MTKLKIILFFLLLTNLSYGQTNDPRLKGVELEIENLLKAYHAAGLSVAVIEKNNIIYSKGFGYRDLENKLPVTSNTVFPIGSITKSFTASLLGILEHQNQLSLKDKPSLYIPTCQFYNDKMDNLITMEDLLSHKSGIGSVDGTYILFPADKREDLMKRMKYLKPNGAIKDSWIYSNLGYIIAGCVVEKVTNESWDKNILDKLFTPLNMYHSSTSISAMTKENDYSFGYGLSNMKTQKVLFAELENDKPGGAINSNVNDLANWISAWLHAGMFQNKEIFPENFILQATSLKAIDNGLPPEISDPNVYTFGYGYGWKINSNKGHYKVHHGGNVSGFSSQLVMYPSDSLGIVVLTNQHNSTLPYMIADILTNRMLNLQRTAWHEYPVKVNEINVVSNEIRGISTTKKPTHTLTDFCGKFANPGFGTFEIIFKNNNLYAIFKNFTFRLEHQYYDIFLLKTTNEIPQIMNPEFYLNFSLDNEGNIASVKINLQDEPVEFTKQLNK